MSGSSLRLFLAASVPDEHLDWVGRRLVAMRDLWPDARWIPGENQHVTVKFLGSTPEDDLAKLVAACSAVAVGHRAGPIGLTQLGAFPSPKRARVLWIGLVDPDGLLGSIAADCDRHLAPLGFAPESRPYSPHLTVARFKRPTAVGPLPPLEDPPGPFPLETFSLWRSHLSPKGARYERLESFQLGI